MFLSRGSLGMFMRLIRLANTSVDNDISALSQQQLASAEGADSESHGHQMNAFKT
jgi:hypothetical protein